MSNGLTKNGLGTAAAQFMGVKAKNNYDVQNQMPGEDKDQHSYRLELCGILANIIMINTICTTHNINDGQVELGCDKQTNSRIKYLRK